MMGRTMVCNVTPGPNVTVPFVAVKSSTSVAVPALAVKSTVTSSAEPSVRITSMLAVPAASFT